MTQDSLGFASSEEKVSKVKNQVNIEDLRVRDVAGKIESYERAVVGTHVDQNVLPGFMYRVRVIGSTDYLFDGRPLLLENIGRGYGKRITFESASKNEPSNYFYSDTAPEGYAFSPVAVCVHDQLDILPMQGSSHAEKSCGRLQVTNITRPQQEIRTWLAEDRKSLWKTFEVHFSAKVLSATEKLLSCRVRSWTSIDCVGICHMVRKRGAKRAEIDHIDLKVGSCLAGLKLVTPSSNHNEQHP